ncbi:sigma 54-interacting transcriptional regulator [Romboutsia sp.]|uniref:sigma 54-interacting transcriptional regulator n=1 Tax=Romboutsia sp. TaxID=1965302 RepID=UPI003F39EF67
MKTVGVIVPYEEMGEQIKEIGKRLDVKIIYKLGETSSAKEVAKNLQDNYNVDAIIARNPICYFVRNELDVPVISLDITRFDLIRAISKIEESKKIAFFYVEEDETKYGYNLSEIKQISNRDVELITIDENNFGKKFKENLKNWNKIMKEKKCNALVTSTTSIYEYFIGKDFQVEYIDTDKYEVQKVILDTINAINIRNKEINYIKYIEGVLNSTRDGVIVVNNGIINVFNKSMLDLTGLNKKEVINQPYEQVYKKSNLVKEILNKNSSNIVEHNGVKYSVQKRYIPLNGNEKCEVINILNIPNIQNIEQNIRRKLYQKGFEAKKHFNEIITLDTNMIEVKKKVLKYAKTNSNILILGESGVGKELFAQSIHNESNYSNGPFVAINCAALPENLLESELYGYEEGAFTGAKKGGKQGLFELSHNGTLFLDEVGELPLTLQSKLLRSIQEKQICRIGGDRIIPINNRIICATNINLKDKVKDGSFREDLYYRIDVLHVIIPSLRERKEDIVILAKNILQNKGFKINKEISIANYQLEYLKKYDWPGNVRQLEAFIERLAVMTEDDFIDDIVFFELYFELAGKNKKEIFNDAIVPENNMKKLTIELGTLKDIESQILVYLYNQSNENIQEMADTLGISRTTLWRKLKLIK